MPGKKLICVFCVALRGVQNELNFFLFSFSREAVASCPAVSVTRMFHGFWGGVGSCSTNFFPQTKWRREARRTHSVSALLLVYFVITLFRDSEAAITKARVQPPELITKSRGQMAPFCWLEHHLAPSQNFPSPFDWDFFFELYMWKVSLKSSLGTQITLVEVCLEAALEWSLTFDL